MDISKLEDALENSWSMGTCYPGNAENWTLENPSYGQCAVTALVVQDYFEGDIL